MHMLQQAQRILAQRARELRAEAQLPAHLAPKTALSLTSDNTGKKSQE